MPSAPPSFGSQEYWNKRFTANSHPFEWLEAPNVLDPYIVDALRGSRGPDPQLLHIGCGTSLLSYHMRAHVEKPGQIHNVDYSDVASDVGRKREAEIFNADALVEEKSQNSDACTPSYMRWSTADLLDHSSILKACEPSSYSVIVDKSTSDSIACSDDIYVPLPYHVVTSIEDFSNTVLTQSSEPLHPLHILAVHLALATKPGGRWISLSYSTDRYPFLKSPLTEPTPETSQTAMNSASLPLQGTNQDGFPDPSTLWRLVGKYEIEPQAPSKSSPGHGITHRPKVLHWIYVLERTDVPLFVRT
ncbi:hypothetical protein BU23DRAFT_459887 [Bimuria novae-zelandiae CBS 107.79]|uniref:Methyltransferase domain-containing protein n=1 Tax=Bimuria novae-zelandiae CBS 107.79 TaxID=1447943 RepID=A0A6A5VCZ1_9PLEO|nr:hypothetical protein BU23DRAFT_459887 [Bimuria novae-zelandiae CBS 107.79]